MAVSEWALVALGLVLALYALLVVGLLAVGRREHARAVAGLVPDCLVLLRGLAGDPRVSRRHKLVLVCLAGYLALPLDLVPDFIPVVGQLDDAVLVVLALRALLRASGPDLVREHWRGPATSLDVILRFAR